MNTLTPRPLTTTEQHQLVAARLVALTLAPYLAHALFAVRPLALDGLGTFAVDAAWRLYLDPTTLDQWGPQQAGAVLVHEVCHLIRDHAGRANALPTSPTTIPGTQRGHVDRATWNIAGDAAINDDLLDAGLPLPAGAVTPAALGLDPGGIEEAYYATLTAESHDTRGEGTDSTDSTDSTNSTDSTDSTDATNSSSNNDRGGCGSGAGEAPAPWEAPANQPAATAMPEAQQVITRRTVAHAVSSSPTSGIGSAPAGMRRWAQDHLTPPTISWRTVLAASIRRAIAHAAGQTDYTYRRPGRRRLPRIITPAMHRPALTAAIVIDTSASMSPDDLTAALAETQGILRSGGIANRAVTVLTCDAGTGDPQRVTDARKITLTGGGGTDMRVGIAAAHALRPRPDVVIVLTDGYTPWPDNPTAARLVIALIGNAPAHSTPPWATTVTVG